VIHKADDYDHVDVALRFSNAALDLGNFVFIVEGRKQNVVTFNMDEYVGLDPSHPQSYRSFMHENCQSQLSGRGHA
jgi:hypothetical protein